MAEARLMNWLDRLWSSRATTPPAATKRIVCLANSRKMGGRCVAGKELLDNRRPGRWVRPVSDREHEEVSEDERRLEDGSEPQVLDVIDVPVRGARPQGYQEENWLLDPTRRWGKVDRIDWNDLSQWADSGATLWMNGYSSAKGHNDRVPEDLAASLNSSLCLIRADRMQVHISYNPEKETYQLRGSFRYKRQMYSLRITDPISESRAVKLGSGVIPIDDERFLTISLGEPFEGFAYKLIAAIIRP